MNISILDDLYRYNVWANDRLFAMSEGLSDDQLDERREMGFGTLRNTLFHILAAEEVWLERWNSSPWRPFPFEAEGLRLAEIRERLSRVTSERNAVMDRHRANDWNNDCAYKDSKGNAFNNRLKDLLLHVANHGIHHRAQALNFLKKFGRKVPGGLDYSFYRFAKPHVKQEPATVETMRKFGLEMETGSSPPLAWDATTVREYFRYGDWANDRLLKLIESLDDAALDRSWDMGMDTLRKTALHVADAERWWLRNWTSGASAFQKMPESTSIAELRNQWKQMIADRNQFIETLDGESAARLVFPIIDSPTIGEMTLRVPVVESLIQLAGHGTHHRAQMINMMRRSGITAPGCDYILCLRERSPA